MDGKGAWAKENNVVVSEERIFQHEPQEYLRGGPGNEINGKFLMSLDVTDGDKNHISIGVQPRIGRIVLFPHEWPHAGGICISLPKTALRAEVTILKKRENDVPGNR